MVFHTIYQPNQVAAGQKNCKSYEKLILEETLTLKYETTNFIGFIHIVVTMIIK